MNELSNYTIHFKDQGQDCLRWIVDANGVVIDSKPFQKSVWTNSRIMEHPENIKVGDRIPFVNKFDEPRIFNHPVERVEVETN